MNLYDNVLVQRTLAPAARTATANGTTVDRAADGARYQDALVVIDAGVVTDGTHTFAVQESADGSSWSAVADADLQGTEPAVTSANDDTVYEIGYLGGARYLPDTSQQLLVSLSREMQRLSDVTNASGKSH